MGYWVVLFASTHVPLQRMGIAPPVSDVVLHSSAYFALTMLGGLALRIRRASTTTRAYLIWAVVYLLYGIADECTQPLVGRYASVSDWLADAAGVAVATGLLLLFRRGSRG